jgi:heptosyltransferase I
MTTMPDFSLCKILTGNFRFRIRAIRNKTGFDMRDIKNILIIRPSAIGDIIMSSPMIRVLRGHYPDAHIAWLIEPSARDLLSHNTGLNELILWHKDQWRALLKHRHFLLLRREISGFSRQLRLRNFDLAIDAQGLLRSRWLAWLSGAKERIGFDSKEPGGFLMTKIHSRGTHSGLMGSEYYQLMQAMGLEPGVFHPEISVSPEDENAARKMTGDAGIKDRYAVFAPFTTRPQKHWIEDRWAELARLIHKDLNLPVVMLGGKDDIKNATRIETGAQKDMINLAGKTGLGHCAAIIKNASLLVGVDTGLTHMGAAFDCPAIALFGATCPYLNTAGNRTVVIYNKIPCSPCRRSPVCNSDFTCMRSIEARTVFDEARKLLEA